MQVKSYGHAVNHNQFNQAAPGPQDRGNWVQKGQGAQGNGRSTKAEAAWKMSRAESTRSASGVQWHPKGSAKCRTGTWKAPSRSQDWVGVREPARVRRQGSPLKPMPPC